MTPASPQRTGAQRPACGARHKPCIGPACAARCWAAPRPRGHACAASEHAGLHSGDALVHVRKRLRKRGRLLALLAALGRLGQQQHAAGRPLGQARRAQLLPGTGRGASGGARSTVLRRRRRNVVRCAYAAQPLLDAGSPVTGWSLCRRRDGATAGKAGRRQTQAHTQSSPEQAWAR